MNGSYSKLTSIRSDNNFEASGPYIANNGLSSKYYISTSKLKFFFNSLICSKSINLFPPLTTI